MDNKNSDPDLLAEDYFHSLNFTYETKELSLFQKLLQVYWANPKSWLLNRLSVKDGNIEVVLKNGKVFKSPLSELKVRKQVDQYDRKEVYLSYKNEKIHFKEIPGMLTEEEWTQIFDILDAVKDSDISLLGKMTQIAMMGKKMLDNIAES
ncbi:hypothetical protein [uncultured Bacteroides sp.]|uniref:hypothetical protein n=1 Tax=uncultured Bacteroides sp. TaxID=162156 RepID=UPI00262545EC|nr:hypothetical protein [uncultured Bacteroides sp.]